MMREATNTRTEASCSSFHEGQVTFVTSSWYDSSKYVLIPAIASELSTGGRTRTCSQRFWRPLLYQLSYTRKNKAKEGDPRNTFFALFKYEKNLLDDLSHLTCTYCAAAFTNRETKTFIHRYWLDEVHFNRNVITRHYHFATFS